MPSENIRRLFGGPQDQPPASAAADIKELAEQVRLLREELTGAPSVILTGRAVVDEYNRLHGLKT
jgi:hypothetical protein